MITDVFAQPRTKRDLADIAQRSHGGGNNLGLKIGGREGAGHQGPP